MDVPTRSEVWEVELGRRRVGTEFGAHIPQQGRPCLIVSADEFNEESEGLTVLHLTEYRPDKEDIISLWAVAVARRDVVPDTRTGGISFKSIIDCAQPWTIFKLPSGHPDNELRWNRRLGRLKDELMIRVEAALQVLLGGAVRYDDDLTYQEGDVIEANLPRMPLQAHEARHRCLVVSSPGIDAIREQMRVYVEAVPGQREPRSLSHCTVVPLVSTQYDKGYLSETLVDVYPFGQEIGSPTRELAICQEIYTIDWQSRVQGEPVGRVLDRGRDDVEKHDMEDVREALRYYLRLPH